MRPGRPDILIACSTVDGQTRTICERLQRQFTQAGHAVTLASLGDGADIDLRPFTKVVIGASIRYGKHRPEVGRFVAANRRLLDEKACAFFSVDLVSRKPGKDTIKGNPYLGKFLRQARWKPRHLAVFAGKLDYRKYGWRDRSIIRLIMLLTGGPTDPSACVEYTDWAKVHAFGERVAAMQPGSAHPAIAEKHR